MNADAEAAASPASSPPSAGVSRETAPSSPDTPGMAPLERLPDELLERIVVQLQPVEAVGLLGASRILRSAVRRARWTRLDFELPRSATARARLAAMNAISKWREDGPARWALSTTLLIENRVAAGAALELLRAFSLAEHVEIKFGRRDGPGRTISSPLGAEFIAALGCLPLRTLRIEHDVHDDVWWDDDEDWSPFSRLERLAFLCAVPQPPCSVQPATLAQPLTSEGALSIARGLPRLRSLELRDPGHQCLEVIASMGLEELAVDGTLGDPYGDLPALAGGACGPRLQSLSLASPLPGLTGLAALRPLAALRHLSCALAPPAGREAADWPPGLASLRLRVPGGQRAGGLGAVGRALARLPPSCGDVELDVDATACNPDDWGDSLALAGLPAALGGRLRAWRSRHGRRPCVQLAAALCECGRLREAAVAWRPTDATGEELEALRALACVPAARLEARLDGAPPSLALELHRFPFVLLEGAPP